MEAIVQPIPSWDEWPPNARGIFQGMRSDAGEELCLEKNLFVEAILPNAIISGLTADEMAVYRAPFADVGEGRRPTLTWPPPDSNRRKSRRNRRDRAGGMPTG